jgi:hypothetical protein
MVLAPDDEQREARGAGESADQGDHHQQGHDGRQDVQGTSRGYAVCRPAAAPCVEATPGPAAFHDAMVPATG